MQSKPETRRGLHMPPRKATRGTTAKAPPMLKPLEDKVARLEAILEHLLYDVKGERGEMLRKRFYEQK